MELYPTFAAPTIKGFEMVDEPVYKAGLYFDFETGDIRLDGGGRIVEAGEKDSWLQWCKKAILTQNSAFLAYGMAYGADMQYAFSQGDRQACEEAIEQGIKNAVMNDPAKRTINVADFEFEWSGDSVNVNFSLLGADGNTEVLSVDLKG